MPDNFAFRLTTTDGAARTGETATPHGVVRTPAFMPVGTQAAIKGVHHDDVRAAGADILLANTYHLMLRPSAERDAALGGLHIFMRWPHPILTDSGGFQVMSLAASRKVEEQGVTFRSHLDGAMIELRRSAPSRCKFSSAPISPCSSTNASGAGRAERNRARDEALAALGRALQARVRESGRRPATVRHRPGRRRSTLTRGQRMRTRRHRFRRL